MRRFGLSIVLFMLVLLVPSAAQNPRMIKDVDAGSDSGLFGFRNAEVTRDVVNGKFFFSGGSEGAGQEIWCSTPPFEGGSTALVKDMCPGPGGWSNKYAGAYDKLFFISTATGKWDAVCRSDGSSSGTGVLYAPTCSSKETQRVTDLCAAQNKLFFLRWVQGTKGMRDELWMTDPAGGAATLLKSVFQFDRPRNVGGSLVVWGTANERWQQGAYVGDHALYSTNGTAKGTKAYYIIPYNPSGTGTYPPIDQHPYYHAQTLIVAGPVFFFTAGSANHGLELWRTDGTSAGTWRVTDINPGAANSDPAMGAVMGGYLYFAAKDGTHGYQIWRCPVAGGAAERVTDIDGGSKGADPMWLTAAGGALYFSAYTPDNGRELWKCNGLPLTDPSTVTTMVADIRTGTASSNPNYASVNDPYPYGLPGIDWDEKYRMSMAVIGDWIYFPADDGSGYALWRSDGTAAQKLGGVDPRKLTVVQWEEGGLLRDAVLFASWSPVAGMELWKYEHWLPPAPKRGDGAEALAGFKLSDNYPNPFTVSTLIRYEIREQCHVRLSVYDVYGRRVATLVDGVKPAGASAEMFHAGALPSGVYTCVLEAAGNVQSKAISLAR